MQLVPPPGLIEAGQILLAESAAEALVFYRAIAARLYLIHAAEIRMAGRDWSFRKVP